MLAAMERVSSTEARRIGDAAERLVGNRLEAQGWNVLARNLRIGRDEVALLAVDPGPPRALVVVEVRRRNRRDFGLAEATLDYRKRTALLRAVGTLLERGTRPDGAPRPHLPLRVDLVALDVDGDGRPSL